jgi:hypothetical protein
LLNSFSSILVYVTFKINQNEIAKTICVMRKAKNNTCQGHCALKAQLKKQAESEQKHENTLKEKVESIYTITEIEYNLTLISFTEINKKVNFNHHSKPNSVSFTIFHPPTA